MTTDNFCFVCKTDYSKPVKREVNSTVILPPLVFPGLVDRALGVEMRMGGNYFGILAGPLLST